MGGGSWSSHTYDDDAATRAAAGIGAFDYTDRINAGAAPQQVNPLVDPKIVAGPTSPHAGQVMREVMISDEHPDPTAIAVILDVTGSNIDAARVAHSKLPELHGLLQRKGYASDPQILFGAIGDANSDVVPLQVGQFESDNRMDEQLAAIYLEGNGGGQVHETYELAAYFLTRHTYLQPWELQGRKGYAFFIGDEMPYPAVRRAYDSHTLQALIGDTLESDVPTEQIFQELQERYEVFFLFQRQGSYRAEDILPAWRKLLGERALILDDAAAVCETIAATLGMLEAGYDADQVHQDLIAAGANPAAARAATKAVSTFVSGAAVATASGSALPGMDASSETERI